jgi:sporulation protein YlmC with PRC-barrel domain
MAAVYAADGRVGYVTQVILDSGSRRVTGLVVAADPEWDGWRGAAGAAHAAAGPIVVPVEAVQDLTDAVLLRLGRAAVARLPRFREADFARPAAAWRVPFDYPREVVRLPRGHAWGGQLDGATLQVAIHDER